MSDVCAVEAPPLATADETDILISVEFDGHSCDYPDRIEHCEPEQMKARARSYFQHRSGVENLDAVIDGMVTRIPSPDQWNNAFGGYCDTHRFHQDYYFLLWAVRKGELSPFNMPPIPLCVTGEGRPDNYDGKYPCYLYPTSLTEFLLIISRNIVPLPAPCEWWVSRKAALAQFDALQYEEYESAPHEEFDGYVRDRRAEFVDTLRSMSKTIRNESDMTVRLVEYWNGGEVGHDPAILFCRRMTQ
jgi:hypothetical protein